MHNNNNNNKIPVIFDSFPWVHSNDVSSAVNAEHERFKHDSRAN